MLRLSFFELIVRTIPESFIFILSNYAFSNTKINAGKYIISSLLLVISILLTRMLPINYGVHTILNIIMQIVIVMNINNIDIIKVIKSVIITTIGSFIFEGLNMLVLIIIFKDKLEIILSNTMLKTIYGFPSLICLAIIILVYYLRERDKFEYV